MNPERHPERHEMRRAVGSDSSVLVVSVGPLGGPTALSVRARTLLRELGIVSLDFAERTTCSGDPHRHGHREWRSLTRFVGAIFLGAGERLMDSIWG